jgi:hypothetical protein
MDMKLTVQTFLTLDGVIQAPGGPEEDPSDAFTQGGWQAPFPDPAVGAFVTELTSHASEHADGGAGRQGAGLDQRARYGTSCRRGDPRSVAG